MEIIYTKPTITRDKSGSFILSVRVNKVRYKERVNKKNKSEDEQQKDANATVAVWMEMLEGGLSPFSDEDKKVYLKLNGKITVSEVLQEYYSKISISKSSIAAYRTKLNVLEKLYGNTFIDGVTTHQLNNILREKVNNGSYSQKTLGDAMKTYNSFFTYALSAGYIKTNPASDISKTIKSDKDVGERNNPFEDDDFAVIMEKLKSLNNQSLYYFCCFLYHACMRPEEIRNIRIKDIDLKRKKITVQSSVAKNNKKQDVPIYPSLLKIINLMDIGNASKNDYLFSHFCVGNIQPYYGDKYVGDYFFGRWFRSILKELGLYEDKGHSIYCFKHTSAIHKLNEGYTVAEISKLCRHSNIDVTLQYLAKISKVTPIDHLESREI